MHCPQFKSREGKTQVSGFCVQSFLGSHEDFVLRAEAICREEAGARSGEVSLQPLHLQLKGLTSSCAGDKVDGSVGSWALLLGKTSPARCLTSVPAPPRAAGLVGNGWMCHRDGVGGVCGQGSHSHPASYWHWGFSGK